MQWPRLDVLNLGPFDHYTLIVDDAARVTRFHTEVLGFRHARTQLVNAGSAPKGEHDMLNEVLWLPGSEDRVVVVTEGLTENSIFRRYLTQYGEGVHHIAYSVDDIEGAFAQLKKHGIETTSEALLRDPISGLRQVFLRREYCGYFVELIERGETSEAGTFQDDNMAGLANTMEQYLSGRYRAVGSLGPRVTIARPREEVVAYMTDPFRLPEWTGHRMIREVDGRVVEMRLHGDLALEITATDAAVAFSWRRGAEERRVAFDVVGDGASTTVSIARSALPKEKRAQIADLMDCELRVLAAVLEGEPERVSSADRQRIDDWHLALHQRVGV